MSRSARPSWPGRGNGQEERRLRANQAAAAAREERRRLLTPPAGWSNGDRFATGEARDWARFMTALQEARASGADILGLASRVWFAPPRSRPEAPPVEPAIWTGPENPHVGNPKLTREMIAEIRVLRRQGGRPASWPSATASSARRSATRSWAGRFARGPRRPLLSPAAPPSAAPPPCLRRPADHPGWRARLVERRSIHDWRVRGVGSVPGDGGRSAPTPPEFFGPLLPEPAIWIRPTEFEWEQEFD